MSEELGKVTLRFTQQYRGYTLVLLHPRGVRIERGGHAIDEQPTAQAAKDVIDEWMNAP